MAFGTLQVADGLQSLLVAGGTVADIGEDFVWQAIDAALVAHNRIIAELVDTFCDVSTQRLRRYGGIDTMQMEELDEHGSPQVQKVGAGNLIGAPLRKFGGALGWTRDYFMIAQASELAAQVKAMFTADVRILQREVKRAVFYASNYTFIDHLIDDASLPVKRLLNADSQPIPLGPNGETFTASTHTHYNLATAAWAGATDAQRTADVLALITDVAEHFNTGKIEVYANQAQETNLRAMTGFVAYLDARIVGANNVAQANGVKLDPIQIYNRAIGIFNGAEVWIKPWIPSGYLFAYNTGQPKPLWIRVRGSGVENTDGPVRSVIGGKAGNNVSPFGDLTLAEQSDSFPLRAKKYIREFGIGVWNRVNGAVLDTANTATYANPTIT